jgi:hypothetical protein
VLRFTTLEKALGVGVVRLWLYLAAKSLRVGITRRCLILPHAVGGVAFPWDEKLQSLDIYWSVDRLDTYDPSIGSLWTRLLRA